MHLTLIAGARPNFMKIAPIIHVIQEKIENGINFQFRLVHTGQHYDQKMSETFFEELNIPKPDVNLECGGGTQAEQTASIMVAYEKDLQLNPTDLVIVVGDVTSTMACTIVAKKMHTKVAHIEAGIRSFDLSMPEEINRMVTDSLADYFFTTSRWAGENLKKEGKSDEKIFFVGNVMIDTLKKNQIKFKKPKIFDEVGLKKGGYLVLTLHRPANVDGELQFKNLMLEILNNTKEYAVVFPMHPRTSILFKELDIDAPNLKIVEPLGYLEFNYLVENSMAVITDSGGITEETTVMGIPCLTLRNNTERPETINIGTNELAGTNPKSLKPFLDKLFTGHWKKGGIPELWDGKSAKRILNSIENYFNI